MRLNPKKDYGFTDLGTKNTEKLPIWDKFRLNKIREIFKTCNKILDFGDSSRTLSKLFSNELKNKERIIVDINKIFNPDIIADICDLSMFENESVDGVICAAILEHVYNPFKAVSELYRVLKFKGKMFVYVPWLFKYHAPSTGEFKDYYRFSKDGVRYLFREFSSIELCPVRGYAETIFHMIPFCGKGSLLSNLVGKAIRRIDRYSEKQTSGFNIYVVK